MTMVKNVTDPRLEAEREVLRYFTEYSHYGRLRTLLPTHVIELPREGAIISFDHYFLIRVLDPETNELVVYNPVRVVETLLDGTPTSDRDFRLEERDLEYAIDRT